MPLQHVLLAHGTFPPSPERQIVGQSTGGALRQLFAHLLNPRLDQHREEGHTPGTTLGYGA
eukprot:3372794-Alexandrium_andersonii.AAC.1